ncbi:MAG: MarR family winged helix-turn-helix transcriptional regulator [Acidimicrobiales bacterium]
MSARSKPEPEGLQPKGSEADPVSDGTGKHLTELELRAWTGFLDASRMLEERLANQLSEHFDMSHRDYEVLVRLDGAGGRLRMSELAVQMVASQPLMSQTVNRLEKRGWVVREESTIDRRSIEAVISDAGRAALGRSSGPHAALVKSLLLDVVAESSLDEFSNSINRVAARLRDHRRRHRPQ